MDIMMSLIAIFQRNTGANLDKQKIIKSIEKLEQSSLSMSPTEDLSETNDMTFSIEGYTSIVMNRPGRTIRLRSTERSNKQIST